jgi:ABC-type dipeptide/oligopeptide/nickel transport system permease subunit
VSAGAYEAELAGTRARLAGRLSRTDWLAWLAIATLAALALVCLFGNQLAPHDPDEQELLARFDPPAWTDEGTSAHLLGTDSLGRDVLSRVMAGARITMLIALAAAAIEVGVGAFLGFVAGYRGGRVGRVIMRWTDIQMAFPILLVILLILLMLGASLPTMILAIGLNGWMVFARLTRAEVARIREEPYVQAARVSGMGELAVCVKHVMPQLRGRLVAGYLMEIPRMILTASALSFLGLGVTDPPSWGLLIGEGRDVISVSWWVSFFPGLAIVITVASLYVFAAWVEPLVDPLRRRTSA